MDFRLGKAIKGYMEDKAILGDCDIVSVAGAVKTIVSPENDNQKEYLLGQISTSKRLHGISEVILMNHTDCGAYGGHKAFGSADEEKDKHAADMFKAAEIINAEHPELTIRKVLAKIDDHEVSFEEIK